MAKQADTMDGTHRVESQQNLYITNKATGSASPEHVAEGNRVAQFSAHLKLAQWMEHNVLGGYNNNSKRTEDIYIYIWRRGAPRQNTSRGQGESCRTVQCTFVTLEQ